MSKMFSKVLRPYRQCRQFSLLPECPPAAFLEEVPRSSAVIFSEKWHEILGPIFRAEVSPGVPAVFVSCPNLVREMMGQEGRYPVHLVPQPWTVFNRIHQRKRGLFFLDGEEWWTTRRKLNPLLMKSQGLQRLQSMVETKTEDLGWSSQDSVVQLESQLYLWSTSTMLGSPNHQRKGEVKILSVGILLGEDEEIDLVELTEIASHAHQLFIKTIPLMTEDVEQAASTQTEQWRDFEYYIKTTLDLAETLVQRSLARHNGGGLLGDFYKAGMTEEEARRTIVDLVLAAVDTTSHTATWALHTLATNHHLQHSLRQEISHSGGIVNCDTVRRLPYLGGVLKEVMRLYPVSPFLTRLSTQHFTLGSHSIQPGTILLVSLYVMGRDGTIFRQPETVLPERWLREGEEEASERRRRAFASLPFGHGARSCIGRRIAEMELQLLVAKVCERWVLTTRNEDVKYTQRMIGIPDKPISFQLSSVAP